MWWFVSISFSFLVSAPVGIPFEGVLLNNLLFSVVVATSYRQRWRCLGGFCCAEMVAKGGGCKLRKTLVGAVRCETDGLGLLQPSLWLGAALMEWREWDACASAGLID